MLTRLHHWLSYGRKAIKLNNDYANAYRNLAVAYFNQDLFAEAAKTLSIAIERFPEDPERSTLEAMLQDLA